jgi:hypothetical protein
MRRDAWWSLYSVTGLNCHRILWKESSDGLLILLDEQGSQTKAYILSILWEKTEVILLCSAWHCTLRLQPLDVAFMNPLSLYYEEVRKLFRCSLGKGVKLFQIFNLFGQACLNIANICTTINGFLRTGVWPLDRNVFPEADFLPAAT